MKPALIVAIALALLVNFAPRSQRKQPTSYYQEEAYIQPSFPRSQIHADDKGTASDDKTPHWYKSPEWVLVVVGFVTALFIGWQSYETRRAANIAQNNTVLFISKDRARIMIQADPLLDQPVVAGAPPETFVTYKLWNHGATKAVITAARVGATVDKSPNPNSALDVAHPMHLPQVIEGSSTPLDCTVAIFPRQLSDADFAAIAEKKLFVRFFGYIEYRDIFNQTRITVCYLRWKPFMGLRNYGSWEEVGAKAANQET